MGMMGKLKEAQQSAEDMKSRLNTVFVTGESPDGLVKVVLTANKEIKDIKLVDDLLADKDELTDMLIIALNRALEKASQVAEEETKAAMKDVLPPGLDRFMK